MILFPLHKNSLKILGNNIKKIKIFSEIQSFYGLDPIQKKSKEF